LEYGIDTIILLKYVLPEELNFILIFYPENYFLSLETLEFRVLFVGNPNL
jgi:hypothetical protein